jgi:hypothetical protein
VAWMGASAAVLQATGSKLPRQLLSRFRSRAAQ